MQITLFPLNTVLFPGGPLPLQIFEPRYLQLVKQCLQQERSFGVCLIKDGRETGEAAVPHDFGTTARIIDWDRLPNGLLGITAVGEDRFIVRSHEIDENNLLIAQIDLIPDPETVVTPPEFDTLVSLLRQILKQTGDRYALIEPCWDNVVWVTWRLAEQLITNNQLKLELLKTSEPETRLTMVQAALREHTIKP